MRLNRGIEALRAAGAVEGLTEMQRAVLRHALEPLAATAAHGFTVARDALDGPDPEFAALLMADALASLAASLRSVSSRLAPR